MSAIRLARAATQRDRILKFAGCYHGHVDSLLASAGSGLATLGSPRRRACRPASPATRSSARTTTSRRWRPRSRATARGWPAIIVEPVAGNMGVVPPEPGFLEALRTALRRVGRAARLRRGDHRVPGRARRRAGALRRPADLTILGKIVGGGLPLAAFGGRAELMERLAPAGDVYQAGTLSGNPLATAAGLSVLRRLRDPAVYDELERRGARLEEGARPLGRVQRVGAMLTLFCRDGQVRRFEDAAASDTARYGGLFRHLLERGIYVAPSQFEAMFVSLAHGDEEIDRTVAASALSKPRNRVPDPGRRWPTRPPPRARCGPRRCCRGSSAARAGLLAARRGALRARARDDLRGLPAALRPAAPVRAGRSRHGAPARRLPVRARPRPHRRVRLGRGRRRSGRADLALRAGSGRAATGDGAAWAATAAPARHAVALDGRETLRARTATPTRCSRSPTTPPARTPSTARSLRTAFASVRVVAVWARSR